MTHIILDVFLLIFTDMQVSTSLIKISGKIIQGWLFHKILTWKAIKSIYKFCRACREYVGKSI